MATGSCALLSGVRRLTGSTAPAATSATAGQARLSPGRILFLKFIEQGATVEVPSGDAAEKLDGAARGIAARLRFPIDQPDAADGAVGDATGSARARATG